MARDAGGSTRRPKLSLISTPKKNKDAGAITLCFILLLPQSRWASTAPGGRSVGRMVGFCRVRQTLRRRPPSSTSPDVSCVAPMDAFWGVRLPLRHDSDGHQPFIQGRQVRHRVRHRRPKSRSLGCQREAGGDNLILLYLFYLFLWKIYTVTQKGVKLYMHVCRRRNPSRLNYRLIRTSFGCLILNRVATKVLTLVLLSLLNRLLLFFPDNPQPLRYMLLLMVFVKIQMPDTS